LEAFCKSFGTEFVRTVDAFDYEALKTAFRDAKNFNGVSVVIVQQTCSIVAKKAGTVRLSSFAVVADKCKGCRKCVNFGCPAVEFDKGSGLAFINAHCFGCGVCAQICSFDAIVEVK
jgi:indolepyruvate ferredoxin oxidoreductase alpha subunit